MDNLNCKMQAHAKMCKENEELEEKMTTHYNNFVERLIVRAFQETCTEEMDFSVLTYTS